MGLSGAEQAQRFMDDEDLAISQTAVKVCSPLHPKLPAEETTKFIMPDEIEQIIDDDEKRKDLVTYMFNMRDKTSESGQYVAFIPKTDHAAFASGLTTAEDWFYDSEDATEAIYSTSSKSSKNNPVVCRFEEDQIRAEWVSAILAKISNYRMAAESPDEKYEHISPDKLGAIIHR